MKIIQKISFDSADYLATKLQQNHEKRADYYFGFQVIYQSIIKIVLLALLAIILGTQKPTIFIVLSFTTIRFFAGGAHMDTYAKCLLITLAAFLPASIVCKHFTLNQNTCFIFLSCVLLVAITVILKWAPKESPMNKIDSGKAKKTLKSVSALLLIFWFVTALLLNLFGMTESSMSISFGLLIEISTIPPAGSAVYNKIDKILKYENRR